MFHIPAHKNTQHPAGQVAIAIEPKGPDFKVSDHFSIVLLKPLTPAAIAWCEEHLPEDVARWAGSIAIGSRFIGDIIDGIELAGLEVA